MISACCTKCGFQNSAPAITCSRCGSKIDPAPLSIETLSHSEQGGAFLIKCLACFAQISKQSSYCPHCGHSQNKEFQQFITPPPILNTAPPRQQVTIIPKKASFSSIALMLLCAVMGLGILAVIFNDFDKTDSDKNKLQSSIQQPPSPTPTQKPSPTPTPTVAGKRRRDFAWSLSDRIDKIMSGVQIGAMDSEYTSLFVVFDVKITEEKARYYLFNLLRVQQLKKLGFKEITITGRLSEEYIFDLTRD